MRATLAAGGCPPQLISRCEAAYRSAARQPGFDGPYLTELTMLRLLVTIHQVGGAGGPASGGAVGKGAKLEDSLVGGPWGEGSAGGTPGPGSPAAPRPASLQELGDSAAFVPLLEELRLMDVQRAKQVPVAAVAVKKGDTRHPAWC